MSECRVSIVIPAFNEERFIGRQIHDLRRDTSSLQTQIIVVDNHSTDRTADLARASGADEVLSASGTVATIRNRGAAIGEAPVLIFMDADVFPTPQWSERLPATVELVQRDPLLVTGSWVSVPENPSWIEKHWFKPLENGGNSHINSGHLILSRLLFERLGGFDERLRTGEDFDLSVRARALGARVFDDVELKVVHEGYPKTLGEFFRREVWHGAGDCLTLGTFFRSKVGMAGFALVHGQLLGAILSLILGQLAWLAAMAGLGVAVSGISAIVRYRHAPLRSRLINVFLYYSYFLARGLSPYASALKAGGKKSSGESRH